MALAQFSKRLIDGVDLGVQGTARVGKLYIPDAVTDITQNFFSDFDRLLHRLDFWIRYADTLKTLGIRYVILEHVGDVVLPQDIQGFDDLPALCLQFGARGLFGGNLLSNRAHQGSFVLERLSGALSQQHVAYIFHFGVQIFGLGVETFACSGERVAQFVR